MDRAGVGGRSYAIERSDDDAHAVQPPDAPHHHPRLGLGRPRRPPRLAKLLDGDLAVPVLVNLGEVKRASLPVPSDSRQGTKCVAS